jgi:hypothetical protein
MGAAKEEFKGTTRDINWIRIKGILCKIITE